MRELLDAIWRVFEVAVAHPIAAIALWLWLQFISWAGGVTYRAIGCGVRRWRRGSAA